MLDHIGIPVSDYQRTKQFYLRALAPLGHGLVMEVDQRVEKGFSAAGLGNNDRPDFWIGGEGTLNRPVHIAFTATNRTGVDAFYVAALAAGAKDNGGPGLRPHYHPNYYAAFVLDPDGHNIDAICHAPP